MAYRLHNETSSGAWNYFALVLSARQRRGTGRGASGRNSSFHDYPLTRSWCRRAAVATAVGAVLGWKVWDHELLEAVAACMHAAQRTGGRRRNAYQLVAGIDRVAFGHARREPDRLRATVGQNTGNDRPARGLCRGRSCAGHILPAETTLRVRLVAPLEDRVTAHMRLSGETNRHDATRQIERMDRAVALCHRTFPPRSERPCEL